MRKAGKRSSLCPLQKQVGNLPPFQCHPKKMSLMLQRLKNTILKVPTKIKFYAFFQLFALSYCRIHSIREWRIKLSTTLGDHQHDGIHHVLHFAVA